MASTSESEIEASRKTILDEVHRQEAIHLECSESFRKRAVGAAAFGWAVLTFVANGGAFRLITDFCGHPYLSLLLVVGMLSLVFSVINAIRIVNVHTVKVGANVEELYDLYCDKTVEPHSHSLAEEMVRSAIDRLPDSKKLCDKFSSLFLQTLYSVILGVACLVMVHIAASIHNGKETTVDGKSASEQTARE